MFTEEMFSERVKVLLAQAGWRQGRRIDVSGYKSMLQSENLHSSFYLLDFMECFGGVKVSFPYEFMPSITNWFLIDPHIVMWRDQIEEFSQRVGRPLSPIGPCQAYQVEMLMDLDGRVYGCRDAYLWRIGDTGLDAIEALCANRAALEYYD